MRTTFNLTLTITILTLATLGGCPTGAPDINEIGNDEPAAELRQISGTWDGVLNCTFTTTLEGQEPITQTSTQNYTVTFDSDGQPARLPVASLSPDTGAADVDITDIGDAATYTSTTEINGEQITITQTASVTSATYSSTSATVTVEYTFDATGTGFTQTGTGAQTYTFSVSGDSMTYTTSASYDVTQTISVAGTTQSSSFTISIECEGTLQRQ